MKKTILSLGLAFSILAGAQAQNNSDNEPVTSRLQNQFSQLNSKSNNYREGSRAYKVIDVKVLNSFWSGILNTVKHHENEMLKGGKNTQLALQQAQDTISAQHLQIAALKKDNAEKDAAVKQNAYEVDNIMVAGIGINKQFFLIFASTLIAALLVVSGVMFSLYKKCKKITDEKIGAFQEIENEFSEYKKTARERELKIKRELQTELNSKEEMRQQLAMLQK